MHKKIICVLAVITVLASANHLSAQEDSLNNYYHRFTEYYASGDFINAEMYLLKSLVLKEPLLKESKIAIYNNLGVINNRLGRYDEALKYLNLAESIIVTDKQPSSELADIYINTSSI